MNDDKLSVMSGDPDALRPASLRRFIVFHLAAQAYGIDLNDVQEILPLAELSRPPACPEVLAGFLRIGAEPIPVIRMAHLMACPTLPPALYTPVLILRAARARMALLVDRVSSIAAVPDGGVSIVSDGYSVNNCVYGIVQRPGAPVLLVSSERLLLEKERQCVEALTAREQARMQLVPEACRE
ncbi:MAG TPA: chemotaxis protein CheW [Pirellulales bacterium]|nr:chemotaxis protein CheW [Pirellulales bacterium]